MGSDAAESRSRDPAKSFNPRSRMGSDPLQPESLTQPQSFNPRSRMGSDVDVFCMCLIFAGFNPRSRMGSDNKPTLDESDIIWFQSTLPYGERLDDPFCNGWHRFVSIHAPVWGATLRRLTNGREGFGFNPRSRMGSDSFYLLSYKCINVSIHAPVWGATNPVCINADCRKFQSTLPYGERRIHCSGFAEYQKVSIHAPVWGATFWILY